MLQLLLQAHNTRTRQLVPNFVPASDYERQSLVILNKACSQGTYLWRLSPGNRGQQTWHKRDNKLVGVALDTKELILKMCFAWILCQYWRTAFHSNNWTAQMFNSLDSYSIYFQIFANNWNVLNRFIFNVYLRYNSFLFNEAKL